MLLRLGPDAVLKSPSHLVQRMKTQIEEMLKRYEEEEDVHDPSERYPEI